MYSRTRLLPFRPFLFNFLAAGETTSSAKLVTSKPKGHLKKSPCAAPLSSCFSWHAVLSSRTLSMRLTNSHFPAAAR